MIAMIAKKRIFLNNIAAELHVFSGNI